MAKNPTPAKKSARRQTPPTDGAPAASPRKQLMENEVLEHATRLFAERGFAGTSLQDVANAMGLKRPALYYYFKSKEDLLDRLIDESVSGPARDLKIIAEQPDLSPSERLHAMIRQNVRWVLTHTARFLVLIKSAAELSPESAQKLTTSSRESIDTVAAVIEEGIEAGEFRPVNPRVAALGAFGTSNWAAWWYKPGGADSIDSIADQLADLALASVQRVEHASETALSTRNVLAQLRQDLDRLEQALDRDQ
ncbi:TetR/AcrR family transcriptional regulator [Streptomyces sp. NPDC001220]